METKTLTGELFAHMVEGGAATLNVNRVIVNELNVFPASAVSGSRPPA